jgi:amino acid transporter
MGYREDGRDEARKIGLFTLCMLLFSQSSAGPCGLEGIVGAVGIWVAILSQVGTVLFFSAPQAIVSVELARGVPENGGYALWAERQLGATWGAVVGLWGVVANCAYSASLVENIADYLKLENESLAKRWPEFGFVCALAVAGALLCTMSLRRTGQSYALITTFTAAVFATLLGMSGRRLHVRTEPFVPRGTATTSSWGAMMDLLIFNAIYFDSAAMYAGETRNPDRTIPLAIGIIAVLVTSVNVVTMFVTYFGSGDSSADWHGGHFAVVAARVSGPRLRKAIVANAFVTNFQILTSNVQNSSYLIAGMAAHGLAPRWFHTRHDGETPVRAVMLCGVLIILFGLVHFELSVAIQAVAYGGVVLVECAAYVVKRTRDGAVVEACAVAMLPAAFTVFSYYVQNRVVFAATFGSMVASGALVHGLMHAASRGTDALAHEAPPKPYVLRPKRPEDAAQARAYRSLT